MNAMTPEMMQFLQHMNESVQEKSDELGQKIARQYQAHPSLPYGKSITVLAVGAINYEAFSGKTLALLRYGHFRQQWPDVYPKGEDPNKDYMEEELVSPAYVKYSLPEKPDDVIVAKTKFLIWFPLNDIFTAHTKWMQETGKKGFPLPDVYIDEEDQWMCTLFNFSKGVVKYCSGPNKDPSIPGPAYPPSA